MTSRTTDQLIAGMPRTTEQMLANRRAFLKQQEAERLGRAAFARGAKAVPAHDPAVLALLAGLQVGQGSKILGAWLRGWDRANLDAPVAEG